MQRSIGLAVLIAAASPALAIEVGSSEFVYASDLMGQGFEPFAVSGAANAAFGLTDGTELYMCFVLDSRERQSVRQEALRAELEGEAGSRTVPNIPVVCVLTQ